MIKFDDVSKEKMKKDNPNWSRIPDHPQGTLIIETMKILIKFVDILKVHLEQNTNC